METSEISNAMKEFLEDWISYINRITSDNRKEFASHKDDADNCQIDFNFVNPYCSWKRGANKNLNGVVRRYFPKKTDFDKITEQQIRRWKTN